MGVSSCINVKIFIIFSVITKDANTGTPTLAAGRAMRVPSVSDTDMRDCLTTLRMALYGEVHFSLRATMP